MAKGKYQEWITEEGLIKLEGWAKDGLTDEQIAKNIGINAATLYKWKSKYSEIDKSLKRGKDVVDRQVENALFKSALEGNTTAQIFWLKNRKPKEWRDKQDIEHGGSVTNKNIDMSDLTTEELRKLAQL